MPCTWKCFRALAVIGHGTCRLFSRRKHRLTGHTGLGEALLKEINAGSAILDGELCVIDHLGRSFFVEMMRLD
jgi:ATP-dependent DNA ligase